MELIEFLPEWHQLDRAYKEIIMANKNLDEVKDWLMENGENDPLYEEGRNIRVVMDVLLLCTDELERIIDRLKTEWDNKENEESK